MRDQWITFIGRSTDIPWLLNQEGNRLIETGISTRCTKKEKVIEDGERNEVSHYQFEHQI